MDKKQCISLNTFNRIYAKYKRQIKINDVLKISSSKKLRMIKFLLSSIKNSTMTSKEKEEIFNHLRSEDFSKPKTNNNERI